MRVPPDPKDPTTDEYDLTVFKDNSNRWRTKSLFVEFAEEPDKYPPIFTVADEDREIDGKVYISAKRKYLEYADPTEYMFATKVFGAYPCWEAVCNSPAILPHIEQWRKELDLKLKGIGIHEMFEAMVLKEDVNAAKWFAEGRWKEDTKSRRGRPSKEEVIRRIKEEASAKDDWRAASERVGIKRVV